MMRKVRKRVGRNGFSGVLHAAVCEPLEGRVLLSVMYVDANPAVPGPRDGSDWAHACADLAPVVNSAVSGDVIRVAAGTYKPTATTDRTISFQLKNDVSILGGYAGYDAVNPDARDVAAYPTILSGDIGTVGNKNDNSNTVVVGSGTAATAILDGFTITAGEGGNGGGIYNFAGSPTIRNCTFSGNTGSSGGGMYNYNASSPTLVNCTFVGNTASSGGGMGSEQSSSPTLINCMFSGNSASFSGGGMYNTSSAKPTLTNCTFSGNSASFSGGGMYNETSPKITILNPLGCETN